MEEFLENKRKLNKKKPFCQGLQPTGKGGILRMN